MKKLKWLCVMLCLILTTSCSNSSKTSDDKIEDGDTTATSSNSKSLDDKIEDGDKLYKDDYREMVDYAVQAMKELQTAEEIRYRTQAELERHNKATKAVVLKYPRTRIYVERLLYAEAKNDPEIEPLLFSSDYRWLKQRIGFGRLDRNWNKSEYY